MQRLNTLEILRSNIERFGDYNAFYYIHRGEIRVDVHLRGDGIYVNSDDNAVNPLRMMASDLIRQIEEREEKKNAKLDQMGLFQ